MSKIKFSRKAKFVVSLLLYDKTYINSLMYDFEFFFGTIDMISPWFPFDHTVYYEKEMSTFLSRRIVVFKNLISQNNLPRLKLLTNYFERKYSLNSRRIVNIDPGYLLSERFVLASCKNYSHRVYIDLGVYADLTLIYKKGNFQLLPWTYPDYAEISLRCFLNFVRKKYMCDLMK